MDAALAWLGSRFSAPAFLGEGGMGRVYAATDALLGRRVAVKVIRPGAAEDRKLLQRFRREAEALARVEHPNVVRILAVELEGAAPWVAMELLEGEPLEAALERGPLERAVALRVVADVAAGLAAVHDAGLVHRDLKPANVFVTRDGPAKLMDFGLARALDAGGQTQLTRTGELVGTLAYLAPELFRGQPADARSDLFSLGVVLHRALGGVVPGGYAAQASAGGTLGSPPPGIEPGVDAVLRRLLAPEPERRPGSAREVEAALRAGPGRQRAWPAFVVSAVVTLGVVLALTGRGGAPRSAFVELDRLAPPLLSSFEAFTLAARAPVEGSLRYEVTRRGGAPLDGGTLHLSLGRAGATTSCTLRAPLLEAAELRLCPVGAGGPRLELGRTFPLDPVAAAVRKPALLSPLLESAGLLLLPRLPELQRGRMAAGRRVAPASFAAALLAECGLPPAARPLLDAGLPRLVGSRPEAAVAAARRLRPFRLAEATLRGTPGLALPWPPLGPLLGVRFFERFEDAQPAGWTCLGRVSCVRRETPSARSFSRLWVATEGFRRRTSASSLGGLAAVGGSAFAVDGEVMPPLNEMPSRAVVGLRLVPPAGAAWPPARALVVVALRDPLVDQYLVLRLNESPELELINGETLAGGGCSVQVAVDPRWLREGLNRTTFEARDAPVGEAPLTPVSLERVALLGTWAPDRGGGS